MPSPVAMMTATAVVLLAVSWLLWRTSRVGGQREVDMQLLGTMIERQLVEKITVIGDVAYIYLANCQNPSYYMRIGTAMRFEQEIARIQQVQQSGPDDAIPVLYQPPSMLGLFLRTVLPTVLSIALILSLWRVTRVSGGGGNLFDATGLTSSKSMLISSDTRPTTRFVDVAGLDEAKAEIVEFVSFLKSPDKYTALGARIPTGALLTGPPGTGKTMLARATAGEAGVPFFSATGSDFVEMYVGVGPARIRQLFKEARKRAPCIIFIDEIDAVGRARSAAFANDERENTLNQLLVEMDGFQRSPGVIVIAGTNRADVLDRALLRPGRFDRSITVNTPTYAGRVDLFHVHLKPIKLDPAETVAALAEHLAGLTAGLVGADIANICNEAALGAARAASAAAVTRAHLEAAIERVTAGLERRSKVISPEERRRIATHEAGHVIVTWFLELTDPVLKVSLVPHGASALGFHRIAATDRYLLSETQLGQMLAAVLGGRAAEQLVYGDLSTAAQDDLERATNLARDLVTQYGFSPDVVGLVSFQPATTPLSSRPYSDATARLIDGQVTLRMNDAYQLAQRILDDHRTQLHGLVDLLLQREALDQHELRNLLGPKAGAPPAAAEPDDPAAAVDDPATDATVVDDPAAATDTAGPSNVTTTTEPTPAAAAAA